MHRFFSRGSLATIVLALGLPAGVALASPPQHVDFSGIWRLDDQSSDTPERIEAMLRREAQAEKAHAADRQKPGTAPPDGAPGGEGRGMPPGGGAGRGMGGLGSMGGGGHGGRGGGRHGGHGRSVDGSSKPTRYATPPWLEDDGVLIVQQDARQLQLRLDSGTQLELRYGATAQQALNGSALVRCQQGPDGLHLEMTFADGAVLSQDWRLDDGRGELLLRQQWRLPGMDRPVSFVRRYRKLD